MNVRSWASSAFEFDAFGAAVGSALVCGALSLGLPFLAAPTASLVCLAVAGWVSVVRRRGPLSRSGLGTSSLTALALLAGSAAVFLMSPMNAVPFRGLILAGGLVPLFAVERIRWARPAPVFARS